MKIRQKLIATILLLSLVPAMVVGAVAYFTISRELKDRAADQVASTAIKQEQKISGILQTRQEEVIKLANRYDFQISLSRYLASSDPASLETLTALLQDKKAIGTFVEVLPPQSGCKDTIQRAFVGVPRSYLYGL